MVRIRWIGGDETRSNSECTHKRRTAAAVLEEDRGNLGHALQGFAGGELARLALGDGPADTTDPEKSQIPNPQTKVACTTSRRIEQEPTARIFSRPLLRPTLHRNGFACMLPDTAPPPLMSADLPPMQQSTTVAAPGEQGGEAAEKQDGAAGLGDRLHVEDKTLDRLE